MTYHIVLVLAYFLTHPGTLLLDDLDILQTSLYRLTS